MTAASTFIGGVLHLAIIPMFFAFTPVNVMIFFLVSGAGQLFWVIPVLKRWSNVWYYIGMGGTAILIALFVIAVPARGLPVSELEITIELVQLVFIIGSIMIVKERTTKAKMAQGRESESHRYNGTKPIVVKQDTEIDEIIDIILQKAIILVPIIDDEYRLIGIVSRFDKT